MPTLPEDLFPRLVEGSPDGILYADHDGAIRYWNAGCERIFGWSASEALGRSMELIIPERLRPRHWTGWNEVMASGVTRYGAGELLAVPGLRKDGRPLSLEFSVQLLKGADGRIEGIAAVLRDVTERFARDKELRAKLRDLEARAGKT